MVKPLLLIFPEGSVDAPICHDDTTLIAPTYRYPEDDPGGSRFHSTSDEDIRKIIKAAADASVPALDIAMRIHRPEQRPGRLHEDVERMLHVVIPHFPLVILAFTASPWRS